MKARWLSLGAAALMAVCGCAMPCGRANRPATPEQVVAMAGAVDRGDVAAASALLKECPALAGITDAQGGRPLHTAAFKRDAAMTRLLIESGADVNAGKTSDGWTALHFAANNGDLPLARLLLDKGATVDARKKDGGTPLHAAAMMGHAEVVALLIARGADVNARKDDGWTPLRFAAWKQRADIVELLRKNGATAE